MGLAYSLKCSLLCSYFYSLAPLFSFSFPHVFAPRVSLIPPGHLISGILPRCHSTRTYHIRNSSSPIPPGHLTSGILPPAIPPGHLTSGILHRPFHPDISHLEFFPAAIPPGHLTSRILPPPPFYPDISHPEFFLADIPPGHLTFGILSGQRSTLSGCLTSGILLR